MERQENRYCCFRALMRRRQDRTETIDTLSRRKKNSSRRSSTRCRVCSILLEEDKRTKLRLQHGAEAQAKQKLSEFEEMGKHREMSGRYDLYYFSSKLALRHVGGTCAYG